MTYEWQIPKMTVHKKLHIKKKFSTKFDDLGVIIMRKRCSIQQGERGYIDQSKVLQNQLFRFFGGHPVCTCTLHSNRLIITYIRISGYLY